MTKKKVEKHKHCRFCHSSEHPEEPELLSCCCGYRGCSLSMKKHVEFCKVAKKNHE